MFTLKVSGKELTQEQYADIDKKFAEDARLFNLFAVKTKLSRKLRMKRVKHQFKNNKNRGYSHTDWSAII